MLEFQPAHPKHRECREDYHSQSAQVGLREKQKRRECDYCNVPSQTLLQVFDFVFNHRTVSSSHHQCSQLEKFRGLECEVQD